MVRKPPLPTEEEVWERVREFAEQRANNKIPVPTLQENVVNNIVGVVGARIERESAQGVKNTTPIYRGEILRVWRDLVKHRHTRRARPNYFTLALLQAALSDIIDDLGDGTIALRDHRPPTTTATGKQLVFYSESASERHRPRRMAAADRELRESDAHWRIKYFIRDHPDLALASLPGPWKAAGVEIPLRLPTSDRIDVVVRNQQDGRRLLIEVKPNVENRDVGLYAQAAKYRAIWRVLHDLDHDGVRCALAAPKIPHKLAEHMLDRHGIESVAVEVPRDYKAPARYD